MPDANILDHAAARKDQARAAAHRATQARDYAARACCRAVELRVLTDHCLGMPGGRPAARSTPSV